MKGRSLFLLFALLFNLELYSQSRPFSCGQKEYAENSFRNDPSLRSRQELIEKKWIAWKKALASGAKGATPLSALNTPVVLPVVVHIIHDNGPENISDLQVQTAIQHLNEAYANTGYYDPADGVTTNIQFCLAQRDPDNQPTNGITRDVSPYTAMSGPQVNTDDAHVKSIRDWDPFSYINIWVVKSMPDGAAGYATLPSYGAGSPVDGIVVIYNYFGINYPGDVVITHEMGHYLGLYHTFEGGCTNNDCSIDGDRVCDTPPDQSIASIPCGQVMNSCSTDVLSGFGTDQNDLTRDYMDYGNLGCMTVFTQGQSDRMNWYIQNVRSSLLNAKSCMPPCPSPVSADFSLPPNPLNAGDAWTFINHSTGTTDFQWVVNGQPVSTARDLVYTFPAIGSYSIKLIAKTSDPVQCSDGEKDLSLFIACPAGGCIAQPPPPRDSCSNNTFQKRIGGPRPDFGNCVAVDAGGNCLVTGFTLSYGAGGPDLQVIKLDPGGNLSWARAYGDGGNNYGYDGVFTSDGGSIHIGFSVPLAGKVSITLYKLDGSGNLQWSKNYSNPGFVIQGGRIIQTTDGNYLVSAFGNIDYPYSVPAILLKIDPSGNIIWARQYFTNSNSFPNCVTEDDDQYVIEDDIYLGGILDYSATILAYAVDKSTGNLRWSNYYAIANAADARGFQVLSDPNRLFLSMVYISNEPNTMTGIHEGFIALDKQGTFRNAYTLDHQYPPGALGSFGFRTYFTNTKDGNICLNYGNGPTDSMDIRLATMTPDGKLIMAKRYILPDPQTATRIQTTSDSGMVVVGSTGQGGNSDVYLLKTDARLGLKDPSGNNPGCKVIDEHPPVSQASVTQTAFPTTVTDVSVVVSDNYPVTTMIQPAINDFCANAALCDTLKIAGPDSVCVGNTDTLVFRSGKEPDCGLPVKWTIDPSAVTLLSSTDSCIRLQFSRAGSVTLYATMILDCKIIRDSMIIHVLQSAKAIDLGDDLALCRQSTVRLDAGSGFRSYLWQDGSVDSTFTAYYPGLYFVNAQDYCGHSYGDSINISLSPDLPFDLGPDLVMCRNDTLAITAPAGFSDYYWTPDERMNDRYAQTVRVYPDQDIAYNCTAQKGKGCTVIDSIHVHVEDLPKNFLSHRDPSGGICDGEFVDLSAVGNWKAYKWFDQTTTAGTRVNAPGTYWLEVTDTNNCVARDSVTVIPGACLPGVYFPNAFTPGHSGGNAIFRPLVSVALDKFYMVIYDRQGEKIFETKDPAGGWDGEYRGKAMGPDTFVWYALYHLRGTTDTEKLLKGTVLLIR